MLTVERRIAALEAANQDHSLKVILVEDGQTEADSLRLAGLPPDARRVIFCSQVDATL